MNACAKKLKISVVIPAHNEEKYITACLESIKKSSINHRVEIVVVLNRCIDNTKKISLVYGAKILENNSKNLSQVRNYGIRKSTGDIIVTIDADSIMSLGMLDEIIQIVKSGDYIGGGVLIKPERTSTGIALTNTFLKVVLFFIGISAGSFWFEKKYFEKINGFDEKLLIGEDLDFAKRLKKYGKSINKKFGTLPHSYITTSCRKFDKYGDWHWFKFMLFKPKQLLKQDKKFADEYFYAFEE
jgi:glycosyltransferase involved in cell wall biosynthesis